MGLWSLPHVGDGYVKKEALRPALCLRRMFEKNRPSILECEGSACWAEVGTGFWNSAKRADMEHKVHMARGVVWRCLEIIRRSRPFLSKRRLPQLEP